MSTEKDPKLGRRQFMQVAGIGGVAAAAVTGTTAIATAQETTWDDEADVVVIGLGLGGLCASLRALEGGASVICIDKAARTPIETEADWEGRDLAKRAAIGGNFNLSGQVLHFGAASLDSSIDFVWEHVRGPERHVGDPANPPVLEKLVNLGQASIDWLAGHMADNPDLGWSDDPRLGTRRFITPLKDDPWSYWEARRKPGGVADYTRFGGYLTSMLLLSKIESAGGKVLEETAATKLITDDDGRVIGLRVRPVDGGSSSTIRAKAVVLATGGFQKSKELMTRWVGPYAGNSIPTCNHNNTGDGHYMALDVGAQMINLNMSYGELNPFDARFDPDMIMQFSFPHEAVENGILVNENGDRVCDEAGNRHYYAAAMLRSTQVNLRHLVVFDNDTYEMPAIRSTVDAMLEAGMTKSVFSADTLEELAEATVAAADDDMRTSSGWLFSPRLVDTVAEYNAAINGGTAHRLSPPRSGDNIRPIATPPFWGIIALPGTGWTQGGPKINTDGAILGRDELPIGGLYGAGDVVTGNSMGATMNSHGGYLGGLAPALIWGLVSGESAAAYAMENAGNESDN